MRPRSRSLLLASALSLVVVTGPGAQDGDPAGRVGVRLLGIPERADPAAGAPDLRRYWQAVRAGDLEDARELLARARRRAPDWDPPADVIDALTGRALGGALDAAVARGDWPAVLDLAETYPAGFTCERPDRLWTLTDALAATYTLDRLASRYAAMLETCEGEADRLYVLERALFQLSPDDAGDLVARLDAGALSAEGRRTYEDIRQRLAGRFITRALGDGRLDEAGKRAAAIEDPAAALDLAWRYNAADRPADARRWFDRAIAWGAGDEGHYGAAVVALRQGAFEDAESHLARIAKPDSRMVRLRRSIEEGRTEAAARSGDFGAQVALAERRQDAGRAVALGWSRHEAGDEAGARRWFDRALDWGAGDSARLGLATVAYDAGDRETARALLDAMAAPGPEARRLEGWILLVDAGDALAAGDAAAAERLAARAAESDPAVRAEARGIEGAALLARADAAYEAGDFAEARDLAVEAAAHPAVARPARLREAWALQRLGESAAAAERFEALWRNAGSAEDRDAAGEGLHLALAGSAQEARARQLAAEAPAGTLADAVRAADARAALGRKDFVTAHEAAPEEMAALDGVAAPWIAQTAALRYTEGDAGRGRFIGFVGRTAAGYAFHRNLITLSLLEYAADIGEPVPGDPVGTPAAAFAVAPTDGLLAVAPRLAWRREGRLSPFAELGTTPIGGEVSPLPVGEAGLAFRGADGGSSRAAAFARPRGDSLLSLAGLRDPATGARWGRVVEWGVEADGRLPIAGPWSVGVEAGISRLTGRDVIDNTRLRAGLSLAYDLGLDGFDYITVGPSYGFERYDENTNFWTFGHGGYFSPQGYHRVAANLNLMTEERRDWILRLDASAGWEWVEEDPADVLPLDPAAGAGTTGGGSSGGPAASIRAEAAWRVSPGWMLGGFLVGATSEGYRDLVAGLTLRHTFGGRASAVSRDFDPRPQELFRR
ncbi:MAG: cellulose synthase subunit BcsC-related outer membrane protein [Azospirillaceae bacterium]